MNWASISSFKVVKTQSSLDKWYRGKFDSFLHPSTFYISRKLKCINTWILIWKIIFSRINWLFQNFEINLFLLFVCMNYVPNQNGKVLEKTLAGSKFKGCKDHIKTSTLFRNDPPSFASSSKISPHSSVTLAHTIEGITSGSIGQGITFKLVRCQFKALG